MIEYPAFPLFLTKRVNPVWCMQSRRYKVNQKDGCGKSIFDSSRTRNQNSRTDNAIEIPGLSHGGASSCNGLSWKAAGRIIDTTQKCKDIKYL